jgi:hypothetical protein
MSHVFSREEEIATVEVRRPHVVLLGAGASRAALPDGDKHGRAVPLLRDVASELDLASSFPVGLQELALQDFEAAYSQLTEADPAVAGAMERAVAAHFRDLELPDRPTIYDVLMLSLREKDAIFTFNWDPFLIQACVRLDREGVPGLPKPFFLHGSVAVGYCRADEASGLIGASCSRCGKPFEPSTLLFPVEKKNYQDGALIEREWRAARQYLEGCFMLTVFGYSAPKTDREAVDLMNEAWGEVEKRDMEETEIIGRPGADEDALRATWDPFIHSHHYQVHGSFYNSYLGTHPRRTGETWLNQFWKARFFEGNPIPAEFKSLSELVDWFRPLFEAEARAATT